MPYADPEKQKAYHRKYMRDRYANDKAFKKKHIALVHRNTKLARAKLALLLVPFRDKGCMFCHEKDPCCLSAHHLDSKLKEDGISRMLRLVVSVKRFEAELKKCICVCENCHRKIHAGRLDVSSFNGRTRGPYPRDESSILSLTTKQTEHAGIAQR